MNILPGEITAILSEGDMSLVNVLVQGQIFHSVIIDTPATNTALSTGQPVRVLFKETEVMIARQVSTLVISVRNQLSCRIRKIGLGKLLCELTLDWSPDDGRTPSAAGPALTIRSIITRNACEQLGLKENDQVIALIKTNEVSLAYD